MPDENYENAEYIFFLSFKEEKGIVFIFHSTKLL